MISVITPCLNIISDRREVFFRKMIESVHNQSYKKLEHIVVDGKSTDGTIKLLEEYQEKDWIKLVVEEKRGIYPPMNKGIKLAKGEYINIMNTDDYFIDLDYLKIAVEKIEKMKVDFIHADRIIKSRTGKPDSIKRGNKRQAYFRMPFRHQTMLVKKEIFDDVGLFDENYQICSDYKWVIKMLLARKKGFYLPKVVVCSLDGGASSNREKCIEEVAQILHECYGEKYGLSMNDCQRIYLRKFSSGFFIKIFSKIKNWEIRRSLIYGYFQGLLEGGLS